MNIKEITKLVDGTPTTVEMFKQLVEISGEEQAIKFVNAQRPRDTSPTVGFLNPYTVTKVVTLEDGTEEIQRIGKQKCKLALRQELLAGSPLEEQCIDGWLHLIADFTPNTRGSGYHVAESFVNTMQDANSIQAEKSDDNGFRYVSWMSNPNKTSEVSNGAL